MMHFPSLPSHNCIICHILPFHQRILHYSAKPCLSAIIPTPGIVPVHRLSAFFTATWGQRDLEFGYSLPGSAEARSGGGA